MLPKLHIFTFTAGCLMPATDPACGFSCSTKACPAVWLCCPTAQNGVVSIPGPASRDWTSEGSILVCSKRRSEFCGLRLALSLAKPWDTIGAY